MPDFVRLGAASAQLEAAMAEFTLAFQEIMREEQIKGYTLAVTFSKSLYSNNDCVASCSMHREYSTDRVEGDRPIEVAKEWLRRIRWNESHKPMKLVSQKVAQPQDEDPADSIPF